MSRNRIRLVLWVLGFLLPILAYPAAFFSISWFVVLLIAGMACLIATVLIEDDDDGYDDTPQGLECSEFRQWEVEVRE